MKRCVCDWEKGRWNIRDCGCKKDCYHNKNYFFLIKDLLFSVTFVIISETLLLINNNFPKTPINFQHLLH